MLAQEELLFNERRTQSNGASRRRRHRLPKDGETEESDGSELGVWRINDRIVGETKKRMKCGNKQERCQTRCSASSKPRCRGGRGTDDWGESGEWCWCVVE